ncbi:acyl carrier protein [Prochlorococcus sp. AH-716-B04]|nr:acyl carrier protein [Prochlorococcus sp. AH-716-B04]
MSEKNVKEFLEELSEALDITDQVLEDSVTLDSLGWDSLAVISSIALIDEYFNKTVSAKELSECKTIGDLIKLSQ